MPGDEKEKVVVVPVATYREGAIIGDAGTTDIDSGNLIVSGNRQWKSNRQIISYHFYFRILVLLNTCLL